MAPGRPKKHMTMEEKQQAVREKSRRFYEKKKEEVRRKRRERYRADVKSRLQALADEERKQSNKPRDPKLRERLARMSLEDALEKSKETFKDFDDYIQGSPKSFVTLVCERYLERFPDCPESALEIVNMYTKKVSRYQDILRKHQNEILNLVGIGDDYYEVEKLVKQVLEVILWLDDIYGAALESQSVGERFRKKAFEFMH
ncbi:hypothetical protein EST38_g8658 [Candolleomyces aberdarensis]|uniref:Uncharacterized protein n=1 Tax=Candolleomyces aberdarensis TaxID=2316362 RepID=A0A4Q2DEV2_9AGAR|nr:hypothetical protein EST38_g8658 [Candolleomyces aberdarensis]